MSTGETAKFRASYDGRVPDNGEAVRCLFAMPSSEI